MRNMHIFLIFLRPFLQCVSEGVEFDIPVETGTLMDSEHVIVYDYDVETKKKIFF